MTPQQPARLAAAATVRSVFQHPVKRLAAQGSGDFALVPVDGAWPVQP